MKTSTKNFLINALAFLIYPFAAVVLYAVIVFVLLITFVGAWFACWSMKVIEDDGSVEL